jgi:FkbM family methyltransferase
MSLLETKQAIIKYLNKIFLKPKESEFSFEDKNIQLLESKLSEVRLKKLIKSIDLKTVIDIGASYGDFMSLIQESKKSIQFYGFEPIYEVFNCLKERFKLEDNFKLYNLALGDFDGVVEFNENDYTYSSSILSIGEIHMNAFPYTKKFKKSEVQIACLDSVFKHKNFERPILIKVDVQGYEEQVICGGKNTFMQADFVIIELSFYELYLGQAFFVTLNKELNELGLFYCGCISQLYSPINGKILQQDALFVRS